MHILTRILLLVAASFVLAQVDIDNSLASVEVVNKPKADKYIRKCEIRGKPLDLMYIVDSSGSVGPQWEQTLSVLKDLTNFVTIAPDGSATRISFLLYAGSTQNIFDFNTFFRREDINARMSQIQPINGVTNTGKALSESLKYWTEERGMRGPTVPKVIFLFGDGRASDYPKDYENAALLREKYNIEIYAFGLGEYLDYSSLKRVVGGNEYAIANSKILNRIFDWFRPWKGIEICEEVPACVPGSHKPLDLLFVVDTSSSVEDSFRESMKFVQSVVNQVNVDPRAVQVAMITYASRATLDFKFGDFKTNADLTKAILKIRQQRGTTATHDALKLAGETFDPVFGARSDDKTRRLAIVVTDGHSTRTPAIWARRLNGLKNVDIFAIGLDAQSVDYRELTELVVGKTQNIYLGGRNLIDFPKALFEYADLLCPGITGLNGSPLLTADFDEVYVQPTQAKCNPQGMVIDVRTRNAFDGVIYSIGYDKMVSCRAEGQDKTTTQVILRRGTCGITVAPAENGYTYKVRLAVQYHPYLNTNADTTFEVSCLVNDIYDPKVDVQLTQNNNVVVDLDNNLLLSPVATVDDSQCDYNLKSPLGGCKFLDATVGTTMEHEWRCSMPPGHRFLVHDCIVVSDDGNQTPLNVLSEEGCQIDEVVMQTPLYNPKNPNTISQKTTAFKFPLGNSIQYKCLVSLCDMSGVRECKYYFERTLVASPVACKNEGPLYEAKRLALSPVDYLNPPQSDKFVKTFAVSSRVINVVQKSDFMVSSKTTKTKPQNFCRN